MAFEQMVSQHITLRAPEGIQAHQMMGSNEEEGRATGVPLKARLQCLNLFLVGPTSSMLFHSPVSPWGGEHL
jgi:hypothetical protein